MTLNKSHCDLSCFYFNTGDNPITLSSSDEDDSRESSSISRSKNATSPTSKPPTPSVPTTPDGNPATVTPATTPGGGGPDKTSEGGMQGFGGFQIEGITSLAVESDDTDESDKEGEQTILVENIF